jgi:pimeloyl-ACP methyl ester carboxylesterase
MALRSLRPSFSTLILRRAYGTRTRYDLGDNLSLSLGGERVLTYSINGDPVGLPLLYLHGAPSSRLEAGVIHGLAAENKILLISPDRPGFGGSTPVPGRTIVDHTRDVTALLDHLRIKKAGIIGGSGGGPYALACALEIPERCAAVGVLAGAPPWTFGTDDMPVASRVARWAAIKYPKESEAFLESVAGVTRTPGNGVLRSRLDAYLGANGDPEVRERFLRMILEGLAQGTSAARQEAILLTQDWGFKFEDIDFKGIKFWHGTLDSRSPIRMVRDMVGQIKNSELVEWVDRGHFNVMAHMGDVCVRMEREMEKDRLLGVAL